MPPRKKLSPNETTALELFPEERWVTMTNALTRAGTNLTLGEKRIIAMAASKLDSRQSIPKDNILVTRISADEYAEVFGLDTTTAYEQLKAAEKTLYERSVSMFEPDFKRKGRSLVVTKFRWVGAMKYHDKEGWVELDWYHKIIPHLVGLKENFSTYKLRQATALRSIYSWRLFELLNRFRSTGWAEYTIEDFHVSMDTPPSFKNDFGRVQQRILDPAIKELASKDGFIIEVTKILGGRRVKALHFKFHYDPQGELFTQT